MASWFGRAILGNPWILKDIEESLKGTSDFSVDRGNNERLNVIKEHYELAVKEKGEYIAVREMRKHVCWYIKNLKDSSKVREKINHMESISEVINSLEEYFKTL